MKPRMDMTFKQLYAWYIGSETWKALREVRLKRDKRTCQRCGATEQLHVHHLTYERFTHEALSDLITVCEDCHDYIHRQAKENPRLTLAEVTKRAIRELRGRRAMRQPQGKAKVGVGKDERCRCGQLIRIRHKHDQGVAQPGTPWDEVRKAKAEAKAKAKAAAKPETEPRHPSRHDPDYIWVCTRRNGWQKERRAS